MPLEDHVSMHSPEAFIEWLKEFCVAQEPRRGQLANTMAEAVVTKTVDLAEVRQHLLESGATDVLDELERFTDLIEPYIEEGGVEE